jgi:hypothetical protein
MSDAIVSAILSAAGVHRASDSAKIGEVVNLNPGRARFGSKQEGSIKSCPRVELRERSPHMGIACSRVRCARGGQR